MTDPAAAQADPSANDDTPKPAVIELIGGSAPDICAQNLLDAQHRFGVLVVYRRTSFDGPAVADVAIRRHLGGGETVPERRRTAALDLAAGTAPVLLVEDSSRLLPGWHDALVAGFTDPQVACVWGPVLVSPDLPARYRALGRMEYGRFDGRQPNQTIPPGNVLAVRGDVLRGYLQDRADGLVEADLARHIAQIGRRLRFSPDFRASYCVPDPYGASLATRFGHGRLYASGLAAAAGPARRAALAVKALAAPGVLIFRAARGMIGHTTPRRAAGEFMWISLMAFAWGMGECTGAVFGPGNSAKSWR